MTRWLPLALILLLSGSLARPQAPAALANDYDEAIAHALDPAVEVAPALEHATRLLMALEGTNAIEARIAVDLDVAERLAADNKPLDAVAHLSHALDLAHALEDASLLLEIYRRRAHCQAEARDRADAIESAERAFAIASQLQRTEDQVDIGCLLARLHSEAGRVERARQTLDKLDGLPSADLVAIALTRAQILNDRGGSTAAIQRWDTVLDRAEATGQTEIMAAAHDQLARLAYLEDDLERAQLHYSAADQLLPDRPRSAWTWELQGRVKAHFGQAPAAIAALESALANTTEAHAADLHEALAELQLDQYNPAAARHHYQAALGLRKSGVISQRVPRVRMAPAISEDKSEEAAILAAVRATLRETELERSRLQRRQAVGTAAMIALAAALLGLGYFTKRRAAAHAELAKDTAELRAENAQLLALRYQLNPHFLFNALNSLRSRVFSNQAEAERLIDRLTAFCRRTLTHRPDGIETVGDECDLLEAFLQIEQSRWEDNLDVTVDFDPAARDHRIPTFLLLPLVENALKYGAQTSDERIVITISIQSRSPGSLVVTVTNSGRWIEPGTAQRRTSTRTGVANVHERLARYYPGRHHFELGPSPAGVTATLTLTGPPQRAS